MAWDHGTNSRYVGNYLNEGCRCDDCRAAHAAYARRYRLTAPAHKRHQATQNAIRRLAYIPKPKPTVLVDRVARRFREGPIPAFRPDLGPCWLWRCKVENYGRITIDGQFKQAHRVMYELLVGPIPEGLQIDHLCRVKACVNPDHLEPVTQSENLKRGIGVGGFRPRKLVEVA